MARFVPIGEPAQDAERQALKHLVDGLPAEYTIYGNAWLIERNGAIYEIDAVVVAPHAIYVVEIKSWPGSVSGNDNDWYIPEPIRSPLKLNRKTAQILGTQLKLRSFDAARPFVEGFVYLSRASEHRVVGPASAERVHTRRTILQAIQDDEVLARRVGERPAVDAHAAGIVDELLTQVDKSHPPPRLIREWRIERTLDRCERYVEHFATHRLTGEAAVLRAYDVSPLADEAERKRFEERFRWEAQVLRRIGEHPNVIHAGAPFDDESRLVLPFEPFQGITLPSWIERYGPKLTGTEGMRARVKLWRTIVDAVAWAHHQGIVHRLLRPEVILVSDRLEAPDLRVGGFELAKQLHLVGKTIAISALPDDRLRWAAPEVLRSFSDADVRSDQFSLGAVLGFILVGKPLFDSTEELVRRNGVFTRVREINSSLKHGFDRAIGTMLELASPRRFKTLDEAVAAVEETVGLRAPAAAEPARPLTPEDLPAGTRLGTDYEITRRLGAGGLSTVYAARHLISGTPRALKVARPDPRAEDALHAEHHVLDGLDHPNIVKAIDITGVVPERKTLVLERVKGQALSERLKAGGLSDEERRQYAENLLSALAYLETKGIVHKDIKPDNLIVGPDGLTLIDFSLAGEAAEATFAGTALYRDPALDKKWTHAADRYAATLCLFELYVGRHAFDGQAPAPGEAPRIDEQDFDRSALADFFRKALHANPSLRYPSASATRTALLQALGSRVFASVPPGPPESSLSTSDAPLATTALSGTALACLIRAGITTQGQLVALEEAQIREIQGFGNKKREEVLAVRAALIAAGVARAATGGAERRSLHPELIGEATAVQRLGLGPALTESLARAGLSTVGRLASATRGDLQSVPSVGPKSVAQIVQALQRFADAAATTTQPTTLDGVWELAAAPLVGQQKTIVERLYGMRGTRATQIELVDEISIAQPNISHQRQRALDVVDRRVLDDLCDHVERMLLSAGGVLRIDEAASRLAERWPVEGDLEPVGVLRLVADLEPSRIACRDILDGQPSEVLARPLFDAKGLRAFLERARALAVEWPLLKGEGTRRHLQAYLPEYPNDPLGLATSLDRELRLTDEGELFKARVPLEKALQHVLRKARLPISLEDLRQAILASFEDAVTPPPDPQELRQLLAFPLHCRFNPEDGMVHPAGGRVPEPERPKHDALPPELTVKDPAEAVGDILRSVSQTRGYRLVVTPPELHPEIGRSIARALGPRAVFVSYEDELFQRVDANIDALDRAARFLAQRPRLRREAEATLDALVEKHGKPGAVVVLGDTALFGTCDALHLVRKLYDLTSTGGRGFWALVIPGGVVRRQPLFNEKAGATVFSIDGAVLPLEKAVPA